MTASRMIAVSVVLCIAIVIIGIAPSLRRMTFPLGENVDKTIDVRWSIGSPRVLTVFPIEVDYRRRGAPLTGLSVVVQFSMPSMSMPENRAMLVETKPGHYTGKGILTMPGGWVARETASLSGKTVADSAFAFSAQ